MTCGVHPARATPLARAPGTGHLAMMRVFLPVTPPALAHTAGSWVARMQKFQMRAPLKSETTSPVRDHAHQGDFHTAHYSYDMPTLDCRRYLSRPPTGVVHDRW